MKLKHFFIPHSETHKKAHLISIPALFIYVFMIITVQFGLGTLTKSHPGVLGVKADISPQEVIRLTNIEREKNGLGPLREDSRLAEAARLKALNMYEENYWAHFSPSGKDPWGFINGAGYQFSYAGENLARNFTTADDTVRAWMASPTHKENILNSKYQDIGIAVVSGVLQGETTTLVVQEFGTQPEYIASTKNPQINVEALSENNLPISTPQPTSVALVSANVLNSQTLVKDQVLLNPVGSRAQIVRCLGYSFLILISGLLLVDLIVLRRRGVIRMGTRHLSNLSLIVVVFALLVTMGTGAIL